MGEGIILTVIVFVPVQLFVLVPTTLYVVFVVGVAVTLAPVELLKLEDGDQV